MAVNINIPKPIIDYNDLTNKPSIPEVIIDNIREGTTNTVQTVIKSYPLGQLSDMKAMSFFVTVSREGASNGLVRVLLLSPFNPSLTLIQVGIASTFMGVGKFLVAVDNVNNFLRTNTSNSATDTGGTINLPHSFNPDADYTFEVWLQSGAATEYFVDGVKLEIYK